MNPNIERVFTVIRFSPRVPVGQPMATHCPWYALLWRRWFGHKRKERKASRAKLFFDKVRRGA